MCFIPRLKLFSIVSFAFCLLFFSKPIATFSAEYHDWEKVASNANEEQFIDLGSIKYKKDVLTLLTKYSEINPENKETLNSQLYEMQIDCEKRRFKIGRESWNPSTGNRLITETIINSCTY